MMTGPDILRRFDWRDLTREEDWISWRAAKIRTTEALLGRPPVTLESHEEADPAALAEIMARCDAVNFALYRLESAPTNVDRASHALAAFAGRLGFMLAEDHRSRGAAGVVALRTSSEESKKGYIPYTKRPMNWHTDGYYNSADNPVKGFILHCHQQAASGGENQLLDPEVAYLRMRDHDPALVAALMHPAAMTIPQNVEPDGSVRPASIGPVFMADGATGRLQMRYTARTRSVEWRDDPATQAGADWLRDWLGAGDPLMASVRLQPGEGIVSNNVLHNRTGFEDGAGEDTARVVLRIRFHERAAERLYGAA